MLRQDTSLVLRHPLLRYHGGKFRIAEWIKSYFPNHHTYVEPFGGGGSVLLGKLPSPIEVYNDLDNEVVNFFEVLRDPALSQQLAELVELTPYSRVEFAKSSCPADNKLERARALVIRAQMGFGSAGATKSNTGFRLDTGRPGSDIITIWNRQPDLIRQAARRFKNVLIENREALQVINDHDRPETLFFVDPPYVLETRTIGIKAYRHEMSVDQHKTLLETLMQVKGMVVLCGYAHPVYDQMLKGWQRIERGVAASGQCGSQRREECLWINPAAQIPDLFGFAINE